MRWLAVILIIIFFYFFFSRCIIEEIDCQINQTPCPEEIRGEFLNFLGKNFFLLNPNQDLSKIKNNRPYWEKILLKKIPFKKVLIEITTRQPVACLLVEDKNLMIDKEAVLLYEVEVNPGLPEIEADKYQKETVKKALEAINFLNQYLIDFKSLKIINNQMTIILPEIEVLLADEDLSFKIATLQIIVDQGRMEGKLPKSIDLRFNKPIITY